MTAPTRSLWIAVALLWAYVLALTATACEQRLRLLVDGEMRVQMPARRAWFAGDRLAVVVDGVHCEASMTRDENRQPGEVILICWADPTIYAAGETSAAIALGDHDVVAVLGCAP